MAAVADLMGAAAGSFTGFEGNTGGGGGAGGEYYFGLGVGEVYIEEGSGGLGSSTSITNAGQPGRVEITFSAIRPQAALPVLDHVSASSVLDYSAKLNYEIVSDGDADVTASGVEISVASDFSNSTTIPGGTGIGTKQVDLTGLTALTVYYTRAFATNSAGTTFSNRVVFTTLVQQPVVPGISNVSVTNINEVGATLDFTVTSDGLTSVTETGIRLSTKGCS